MGKKSKQKQNRRKQQPQQVQSRPAMPMPATSALGERLASQVAAPAGGAEDYGYVRADMRKIGIFFVVVVAFLAATVIVNARSSILLDAGSTLAHFLELQ